MKLSLALGQKTGLSRQTAMGCLVTNLAVPGFGSLAGGRRIGYAQVVLTEIGFGLTLLFGGYFLWWGFTHWSQIHDPYGDPLDTLTQLWLHGRWAFLGVALVATSMLWALITSLSILGEVKKREKANKPPRL